MKTHYDRDGRAACGTRARDADLRTRAALITCARCTRYIEREAAGGDAWIVFYGFECTLIYGRDARDVHEKFLREWATKHPQAYPPQGDEIRVRRLRERDAAWIRATFQQEKSRNASKFLQAVGRLGRVS